jgi:hypothetical protein
MIQRPPDELHLSLPEGVALIERLERNTLSTEDRCLLVQVVRWLFWLLFVVQEAKLSLKRLRTLLFGSGTQRAKSRAPEASSPSSELVGEGDGAGERRPREAEASGGAEAASAAAPEASNTAVLSKPTGGHRLGTGRLEAEAYAGAERVKCRHEE